MVDVPMVDAVDRWPLARLKPYAGNARQHPPEQVAALARAIAEFGFVNPILVDPAGEVIAGHDRLLAARRLGLAEVPVMVVRHLDPESRRALRIADNKLPEGSIWDEALLADELAALAAAEIDIDAMGFSAAELDALLARATPEPLDGFDALPGAEAERVEAADTQATIGSYRFMIKRADFLAWEEALRQQAGFRKADILAEIRRRLGLPA